MSDASAYRVIEMFLNAVDYNESCRAMQVRLPRSIDELNELTQRWRDVSTCPINMLNGHIGAGDGWFPRTEMPGDQVNQTDYYSVHYQAYGLTSRPCMIPTFCSHTLQWLVQVRSTTTVRSHIFGTCKIGCRVYLLGASSPQTARMG